jgi:DNA processing protein
MSDSTAVSRIAPDSEDYPESVALAYGRKAPVLHMIGNLGLLTAPGIGFCGSRNASEKGLETTADCAEQAGIAGFTVVSGNAAGVDFVAHHTALKNGGSTIMVLPEGIDHFRIKRNLIDVWDWNRVLVISQFEPSAIWKSFRAMDRNKVIIALSRAMIVLEAGETGGTLNAGLTTLAMGKPLFVAVYQQMDQMAVGNALLLDKGARPLAKSKTTGRANLERVCAASERKPFPIALGPKVDQPTLL